MADSRPASYCKSTAFACLCMFATLAATSGCTLQAKYSPPAMATPGQWSGARGAVPAPDTDNPFSDRWWTDLHDPAIDTLVLAALGDSPAVDEMVARTDEARAALRGVEALRLPSIQANANIARQRGMGAQPGETEVSNVASAGFGVGYELDLFGRGRESARAAANRLAARAAEVDGTRLTLVAQVAEGVVGLRACAFSGRVRALDIESRAQVLELTHKRVAAGLDARVEESRARNSLASARTDAALLEQECKRQIHALEALTGRFGIRAIVLGSDDEVAGDSPAFMPMPPPRPPPLPAIVLAHHPDLLAADRDAAAAWSDIAVARAARLPRIDLGAVLTGNWLRAAGSTLDFTTGSLGSTLAAPLFDGGAGASNVEAGEARYRAAVARLRQVVRRVVQEVEQALAFEDSSRVRVACAQEALSAARDTFSVTERRWRAGATNLFELEEIRRQRAAAEDAAIAATRDQVQAWIALLKAIGVATPALPNPQQP